MENKNIKQHEDKFFHVEKDTVYGVFALLTFIAIVLIIGFVAKAIIDIDWRNTFFTLGVQIEESFAPGNEHAHENVSSTALAILLITMFIITNIYLFNKEETKSESYRNILISLFFYLCILIVVSCITLTQLQLNFKIIMDTVITSITLYYLFLFMTLACRATYC